MDAFLFARVAVATEEELVYWLENADADQSPELPINSVNELKALEFVAAECSRRLQRYGQQMLFGDVFEKDTCPAVADMASWVLWLGWPH